ncbi:hypothetical protein K443DRAFT_110539, partial [Laccaria amethystina LaAM-08-1]
RKGFKSEWRKLEKKEITLPINDAYRPNTTKWTCTCPAFVHYRFLICKHLIQRIQRVPAIFFLEARRFREAPFWRHRSLKALDETETEEGRAGNGVEDSVDIDEAELDGGGSDDEDEFDVGNALEAAQGTGLTFEEAIKEDIDLLDEFLQGLYYQVQFRDQRMLNILEREGAGLFRLARACLHKEKKFKSKRGGKAPSTWEKSTINALFYRTRPADSDVNT